MAIDRRKGRGRHKASPARPEPARRSPVAHAFSSSWVSSATWDPETHDCVVRFTDGARVTYSRVTETTWEAFTEASSAGQFVRQYLEKHSFRVQ